MDQNKTDQILGLLLAKMDDMNANQHEMMAGLKKMNAKMDAWLGKTEVCWEEKEPAPEVPKAMAETEEVPEGATGEEAIGAAKDRSRNLRLAVRCRGRLKTRTKPDGRLRQDCAATVGQPTRRFVPALRKGGLRKGLGEKCHSGIKGPSRTLGCRMGGRSLKKQRTKFNVTQGNLKDRTCEKRQRSQPECNSGIRRLSKTPGNTMRGWTGKLDRRLKERTLNEAIRKIPRRDGVKIAVKSSIGLREPGDCLLWKC
jgi:hypothetical protein